MEAGASSFARAGLRRTTIEELARAAGISKGAFYGFYDSKESLFLALVDASELQAHAEIEDAVRADPHRGIEVLLERALHALERNPLLAVTLSEEGLRLLRARAEAEQRGYLERDERLISPCSGPAGGCRRPPGGPA